MKGNTTFAMVNGPEDPEVSVILLGEHSPSFVVVACSLLFPVVGALFHVLVRCRWWVCSWELDFGAGECVFNVAANRSAVLVARCIQAAVQKPRCADCQAALSEGSCIVGACGRLSEE